jgi:hypothetical protein
LKNNESNDDDLFRIFVLFTICFYLCPTLQSYANPYYLGLIEDTDIIKNPNWSSLVVNYLIGSIRSTRR